MSKKNSTGKFLNVFSYYIQLSALLCAALFFPLMAFSLSGCGTTVPETKDNIPKEKKYPVSNENIIEIETMAAVEAYYDGRLEESIEIFENIIRKKPGNIRASLSLARLLEEAGLHGKAYSVLNSISLKEAMSNESAILPGSMWEDPFLPLFLAGDNACYLNALESSGIPRMQENHSDIVNDTVLKDSVAEKLFFAGWAYLESGFAEKAAHSFASAIDIRGYFPAANLMLGNLYYTEGDFISAEKNLAAALRLDSNLTQGRPFLAKSIIAQNRLQEGHSALRRAMAIRPWDTETALFLSAFEKVNPDLIKLKADTEKKKRSVMSPLEASFFTAEPDKMPSVRVGLAEKLDELFLKPGAKFTITDESGSILHNGEKNGVFRISYIKNKIEVYSEDDIRIAESAVPLTFSCTSPESTILLFDVAHSSGYQSAGQEDRSYRGKITIIPFPGHGITVINILPLEEYLYSVVPSEMPSSWPDEALAAQAVAARSYTLANMNRFEKRGFDVSGSIISAFYRGVTGENDRSTAAVEKTRGLVLKNNGNYINAFYSANSAGRTESAKSVWKMDVPIIGVTDPQLLFKSEPPSPDELARWILSEPQSYSSVPEYYFRSSYRWRLIVPREEIEARIGKDIGDIISITTRGRGLSGRVEEVLVKGTKGEERIKDDAIRSRLGGLRSNLFIVMPKYSQVKQSAVSGQLQMESGSADILLPADVEASPSAHRQLVSHPWPADVEASLPQFFIFAGAGWGHGVGMCQTGAAGMAKEGFTAPEILNHYYPLGELVKEY